SRAKLGHVQTSYGEVRFALPNTDRDPNNPNNLLIAYSRQSNPGQWQNGLYETREHVWPRSRGVGSGDNNTAGAFGDIHHLRPLDQDTNSDRSNASFGTAVASGSNRNIGSFYYPGDADAGDVARIAFYMATRWEDRGLKIVNGAGNSSAGEMGDLRSLLAWHYRDVPDTFERRRNHVIYTDYTNNRNAYIDRPEYAWAAFAGDDNDTLLYIGLPGLDGSSVVQQDFGKVLAGSSTPTASFTINKLGDDGTYYSVTSSGDVAADVAGRLNAFELGQSGGRDVNVTVSSAAIATPGAFSGSVTVDNLDVTLNGGNGRGGNDGDDVAMFGGTAVAASNASFAATSDVESLTLDLGIIGRGLGDSVASLDVFNFDAAGLGETLTAGLDLDGFAATNNRGFSLAIDPLAQDIAAGESGTVDVSLLDTFVGVFEDTYAIITGDADNVLGGRDLGDLLTLDLVGEVRIGGDTNGDQRVDLADFLVLRTNFGADADVGFIDGDFNRDGTVDLIDFLILRDNFGVSSDLAALDAWRATVPEPSLLAGLVFGGVLLRRRSR
ncbi:MAG: endonuclease, partial [Planctomycetota bacterium]